MHFGFYEKKCQVINISRMIWCKKNCFICKLYCIYDKSKCPKIEAYTFLVFFFHC